MRHVYTAAALLLLGGCFIPSCLSCSGGNFNMASGTLTNDDIEEPLPDSAKRFEPLLEQSNAMVQQLRDGGTAEIYDTKFDESLKTSVSRTSMIKIYDLMLDEMGPVTSFKPMQWKFMVQKAPARSFVNSTKIVMHAKGRVDYTFTFADEHATRLIGIHFNPRAQRQGAAAVPASKH